MGMGFRPFGGVNGITLEINLYTAAFSCMTARDSYKKAFIEQEAFLEIERNQGAQFDSSMVQVFLSLFNPKFALEM